MVKNRIGELRREQGLSQKELGDRLGVGQTTVSAWEIGRNEPDYMSIRMMATLFGASADYLMGLNDDHQHRGLTPEQFKAWLDQKRQDQEQEQIEQEIERQEQAERQMYEEIEMMEAQMEWQESGLAVQFETYQAMQLMENASKAQRQAALAHVQIAVNYPQT